MKQAVIILAKNLEEAQQKASKELHLPPEALDIVKLDNHEGDTLEGATPLESRYRAQPKLEKLLEIARDKLVGLLKAMDIMAEVRGNIVGNLIHLRIKSPETALLTGKKGATLEAILHFINRVVTHGDKDLPFILIDVEGYNDRRYQRLEREAMRAIRRAKTSKREVTLKPMRPNDRKVIHNVVKGIEGVISYSKGKEKQRRVIIAPVKENNQRNTPELTGGLF